MSEKFNLRNDEIQMRIVVDGALDDSIVDFTSATVTLVNTKHAVRYVGRTSMSLDDQFEQVDVSVTFQPRSKSFLSLMNRIKQRAQRQVAQNLLVVNFVATLQFVDGTRPKLVVPDLKFGNIPLNLPAEGYADVSLDGSSEDFHFIDG